MQTGKGSVGPQLLYKFVKACSTKFNGITYQYRSFLFFGDYAGYDEYWYCMLNFILLLFGTILPLTTLLLKNALYVSIIILYSGYSIMNQIYGVVDSWLPVFYNLWTTGESGMSVQDWGNLILSTIFVLVDFILFMKTMNVLTAAAVTTAEGEAAGQTASGGAALVLTVSIAMIEMYYVINNIYNDCRDYDDDINWSFFN